jgi:hypothetical protein
MMILGTLLGAAILVVGWQGGQKLRSMGFLRRFRPKTGGDLQRFQSRMQQILKRSNRWNTPAIGLAGLAIGIAVLLGGYFFALGIGIGYGVAWAVAFPLGMKMAHLEERQKVAVVAAKNLVRYGDLTVAEGTLLQLAGHRSPQMRLAAVYALKELGTKTSGEMLDQMADDPDPSVAAAARDSLIALKQVFQGHNLLSVRHLETYIEEHKFRSQQLRNSNQVKRIDALQKLHEIEKSIEEIVFSQLPLRRSFPDLFCAKCLAKGEQLSYSDWQWVRCRHCHEVHDLKPGIRLAIGQIGGEKEWDLQGNVLRISLWNREKMLAKPADIDVLEIIGGKEMSYDWAVSAVVEKMYNLKEGFGSRIKVKLLQSPVLEANTLNLLKTLDPSLLEGR